MTSTQSAPTLESLLAAFADVKAGRTLVSDYTTKCQWVVTSEGNQPSIREDKGS